MENSGIQEVFFKVNLSRVGNGEDFVGEIFVGNKVFDFNLSAPYSIDQIRTIDFKKTSNFFNSIDLALFDEKGKNINLKLKEFLVFYTVILSLIKITYQKSESFDYLRGAFSIFLPHKTIKLLNQPELNCEITF
jgi:hypothetical protein